MKERNLSFILVIKTQIWCGVGEVRELRDDKATERGEAWRKVACGEAQPASPKTLLQTSIGEITPTLYYSLPVIGNSYHQTYYEPCPTSR
jgi:hypothetical protein